jgi:hypothetical protein
MRKAAANLIENSIQIAWNYLDRTGELGEPEIAARVLMDTVERMIRHGERGPLMLSNKAIDACKRFRSERHLVLIS